jgi:hypothetical protein
MDTTAGISRACVLVNLSFNQWTGRKKDKATSEQVVAAKNAMSSKAASVNKYLLADCKELEAIGKFISSARKDHLKLTLPWQDTGTRLLPAQQLMRYSQWVQETEERFTELATTFFIRYDTLVTAAAFSLGDLFDRNEYPDVDVLKHKFGMHCVFEPVPTHGDFRLDIDTETKQELVNQYEKALNERVQQARQEMYDRTKEMVERMVDRLSVADDGKKNKFHDTLVTNAQELVDLLGNLNPTNDPQLEAIRSELSRIVTGVDADTLRSSDYIRETTRDNLAKLLDTYEW